MTPNFLTVGGVYDSYRIGRSRSAIPRAVRQAHCIAGVALSLPPGRSFATGESIAKTKRHVKSAEILHAAKQY